MPDHVVLHEGIKEWQRWKNDMPMRYVTLSDMPLLTRIAFEYICRKLGRDDPQPDHQMGHEAMVAEQIALINMASRR